VIELMIKTVILQPPIIFQRDRDNES